jgi:hypothetical protein
LNKSEFNEKFRDYLNREYIILNNNKEEFLKFIKNKKIVFCKPIKGMMESQYPCIDKDGNIPLQWSVDYDFENLIGEEKGRAAVVEAEVGVTTGVDDIYELLLQLPKISEVELQLENA